MNRKKWVLIYVTGLAAFTIYITLDTFVISSAYTKNATEINTAVFDNIKKKSLQNDINQDSSNDTSSNKKATNVGDDKTSSKTESNTGTDSTNERESSIVTEDKSATKEDSTTKDDSTTKEDSTTESDTTHKADFPFHGSGEHSRPGKGKHRPGEHDNTQKTEASEAADTSEQSSKDDNNTSEQSSKDDNNTTDQSNKENGSTSDKSNALTQGTITETSEEQTYSDDNIQISLKTYDYNDTKVYVADIQLSSAEYLKTAFANDTYGKNITANTSEIAEEHDAILAINGDYYGVQESGYVIRNGVVYRDIADGDEILCIYADGTFKTVNSTEISADDLVEQGVWQAFSFGPSLIENGSIAVSTRDEVGRAMASNPRTAIGQISDLHYVFVVSDGRTDESEGLSLYELASFMDTLGVETAYNLDGGGSSSMVFQGTVINKPTSSGNSIKERGVSDIVYIG